MIVAKISVIIPVYNMEQYLDKCLQSIINQTFKDIEIICINDGSTDNSLAILEKYASRDNRITIINKPNGGLSSAWNKGLEVATAEYVTFVDSDDWIEQETYEIAYTNMLKNNVDYVCWSANPIFEYNNDAIKSKITQYYNINFIGKIIVTDYVISKTVVTTWSKLYKKSIIDAHEIKFLTNSGHDDFAFWLQYAVWAKYGYYIPQYLYNYVQRPDSIMGSRLLKNSTKIFDNIVLIPSLIKYYNKNNLTQKHYDMFHSKLKYLFFEDYNFQNGKNQKQVLEKLSYDLNTLDLGILNKSKFINAVKKLDVKYFDSLGKNSFLEKLFSIKNNHTHKVVSILGLKLKIRRNKNMTKRGVDNKLLLNNYAINQLRDSGLIDYKYYNRQCPSLNLDKLGVLQHYLIKGWKENINPSFIFDGNNYIERYPQIKENPLLYFLNEGRYRYKDAFLCNKYEFCEDDIIEYNNIRKNKPSNKVVYTCITGNYDDLEEIKGYTFINFDWDYVCFTDNQNLINQKQFGIWKIRPLQFTEHDDTRNNRWHKINPHLILPEYDESIYIDANINILTDKLFKIIDTHKKKKKLMLAEHASTICLYKEFEWVLWKKVDKQEIMEAHLKLLQDSGFPKNYGMPENNIIYRQHNKPEIISLMEDWWYMVENYTKRDQLSLPYVLWKHNILTEDVIYFPNTRVDYKNFCTFIHKGKR